jgi:hypothetical protein
MHVNAFCPLSFLKNINFHSKLENLPKINMKNIEESSLEKIVSKQIFLNTLYNEIKNNMFDYDYLAYNINNNSPRLSSPRPSRQQNLLSTSLLMMLIFSAPRLRLSAETLSQVLFAIAQEKVLFSLKHWPIMPMLNEASI